MLRLQPFVEFKPCSSPRVSTIHTRRPEKTITVDVHIYIHIGLAKHKMSWQIQLAQSYILGLSVRADQHRRASAEEQVVDAEFLDFALVHLEGTLRLSLPHQPFIELPGPC